MQASKAAAAQNQIASASMNESEVRNFEGPSGDPLAALQSGIGFSTILCGLLAVGIAVLALVASGSAAPVALALLAALALFGGLLVAGLATGHLHFGGAAADETVLAALAESFGDAVLITDRNGRPLVANGYFTRLAGQSRSGAPPGLAGLGLENVLGTETETQEALFRLMRAAVTGHSRSEEVQVTSAGTKRWLRVAVRPLKLPGQPRAALWQICDISGEHAKQAANITSLEAAVSLQDAMPVGLIAAGSDGGISYANATICEWIGFDQKALLEHPVKLSGILVNGEHGIRSKLDSGRSGETHPIELDMTRADGRLLPVRAICRRAASGDDGAFIMAIVKCEDLDADQQDEAHSTRFARAFEAAPFGIATVGADGVITSSNMAFARMLLDGRHEKSEPAIDVLCRFADGPAREAVQAGLANVLSGRANVQPIEIVVGSALDHTRRLFMSPLTRGQGGREAAVLYLIDATEEKRLEAKFAQSHKMEAVGTLAGGIAHDFNNVLTAIIGFSDFLLESHKPSDPAHRDIMNIKSSANRAAGLVSKLLAFSRQQTLQIEVIDLGEVVSDLVQLLKRSIGERIELKIPTGRDLWLVKTDKTQLERVIINLAVNARDAMPEGGTLTIRTRNVTERDCQKLAHTGLAIAEYVLIEVEDTGTGMSPEVLAKIFEPFFTTKGVGKGTGLGLATVYGIVKQSGGFIYPESAAGKGTTFRVYLPRYLDEGDEAPVAQKAPKKERVAADLTGSGRVLLVEDEDIVRSFAVRALKSRGYDVLEASTGIEALDVMQREGGRIDIVVSDVVMPEMDGPALLKELRKTNPGLKIIFVSGYPNDAFKASLDENERFAFLPKPFSLPQLAAKVKEELGR